MQSTAFWITSRVRQLFWMWLSGSCSEIGLFFIEICRLLPSIPASEVWYWVGPVEQCIPSHSRFTHSPGSTSKEVYLFPLSNLQLHTAVWIAIAVRQRKPSIASSSDSESFQVGLEIVWMSLFSFLFLVYELRATPSSVDLLLSST